MRVLVTGHTGFKGSWLTLLLTERGHEVSGIALDPIEGGLFEAASLSQRLVRDVRLDIRDAESTQQTIKEIAPEVVFHLAAQPLVRTSYEEPRVTIETNVMGSLNVLEGISSTASVQAAVIVTTDKVYRNTGSVQGYVESDALGGEDPYSASKSMADILASSWAHTFNTCPIAIARAGNVIGGGDVSVDRLFPDLIRGFAARTPVLIRQPDSIRPWQHVLDCLRGYLLLMDALIAGTGTGAWNFGPNPQGLQTVGQAADLAAKSWGDGANWVVDERKHPPEASVLTLDSSRARSELGWQDLLEFREAISWTVDWERRVQSGMSALDVSIGQIREFDAREQ